MKKGLLSILAGALLVVGCQNYDDQFDSLETQINSLASTVAGLSQVQSQLAELAGTVSSLTSTVNGLGSTIDTAVADGLADIQADIDAITTAVADVASSEEVSALSDAVADAQTDLTDLLAASSVFTGDVNVNSAATLDAFLAMKASLAIVNGNVNITVSTAMDQTKVQSLVDSILTIVKDLTYTSAASSIAETTFDNLTGVQSITITQGGGIRFPNLISATTIDLKSDFESTVDVIHFGSLTTVTAFETDGTVDLIQFNKASELHLTSLAYYPNASLTIETDEGAAMPFALDDIDADGDTLDDGLTLNITGPASFSISNIADGSITLTDVKTVSLTDYKGAVILAGDVESFTSNSLVSLTVSGTASLETVDITGVADPDAEDADDDNYYGPSISLSSLSDLETVTIAGKVAAVTASSNGNLTDITISADVAGAITINSNSDLTAVTLTGAKATSVTIGSNSDLAALTVDLTYRAGTGDDDVLDGALSVTENASLESLTVSSDKIETLTVTGNDDLTTVDFTGLKTFGATGEPTVNIYDNDLTASKLTDSSDGTTNAANGASGDLGTATSDSGISTLKTYLTAVAADADSTAAVYFDTVESFITEAGGSNSDILYSSNTAQNEGTILLITSGSGDGIAAGSLIKVKRAYIFHLNRATDKVGASITAEDNLFAALTDPTSGVSETIESNADFMLASLQNAANVARWSAFGMDITSSFVASSQATVTLYAIPASTGSPTLQGERYVSGDAAITDNVGGRYTAVSSPTSVGVSGYGFGLDDLVTFTVGGNTVTVSPGGAYGGSQVVTTVTAIANAIKSAYGFKYGKGGTASGSAVATITSNAGVISVRMFDQGTAGNDVDLAFSVSTGTDTATNAKNLDWKINGIDRDDNSSVEHDILFTVTAKDGTTDVTSQVSWSSDNLLNAGTPTELTTTRSTNSAISTDAYTLAQESADPRAAEGASAGVADTTPAVSFSRVAWL